MLLAEPLRAALPRDVPVDPDAETARAWLRAELGDPVYHQRESLLSIVLRWLSEQLDQAGRALSTVDPVTAALVVAGAVAVVAAVALVVAGPVRRARAARRAASTDVLGDDTRTAAELRASADALAREGRWAQAVLDRFRAVLRSLEERVVLEPRPGRTAHEAAVEAGARLPALAAELAGAGRLFDDVCYGHARATADDDARLRALDARVAATRPTAPAQPEAAEVGA